MQRVDARYGTDFIYMADEVLQTAKQKRGFRYPIMAKAVTMIFVFALVIIEIAMTFYALVMSNRNMSQYGKIADSVGSTIANVINKQDVAVVKNKILSILDNEVPVNEIYVSDQEDDEEGTKAAKYLEYFAPLETDNEFRTAFANVKTFLRGIVAANEKNTIDCAYISFLYEYEIEGEKQYAFVYAVDSAFDYEDELGEGEEADEYACPPGWLDPVYPVNQKTITNPERGFPAYTTDTEDYGKLMTAGGAIKLGENNYAYGCADFSLNAIRKDQATSIIRLFIYLLVTVNILAAIGLIFIHFLFIKPIKKLTATAKSFNKDDPLRSHTEFVELKSRTHDEISDLTNAMKVMESSVAEQITNLTRANEALVGARNQAHKMSILANKDPLTGVQSKIAYHAQAEAITDAISQKKAVDFGVAMIDLNYLKSTNDEYGHNSGDESLIKLANMICLTFKHSPVYRFGGDEFIVIMKGEDYKHSKELIEEFNERIQDSINNKSVPLYKRISAAIGYSAYDKKKDTSFEDVFKRADQAMYIRKHEMKEKEQE